MKIRKTPGAAFLMVGTAGAVLSFAAASRGRYEMFKIFTATFAALALAATALGGMGDVISSFKMPVPANTGLAWDGQYLWACQDSLTSMYCITTGGSLVSSFRMSPTPYGYFYGATYDGRYLWACESQTGRRKTFFSRFTTAGSLVGGFEKNYESKAGMAWEPGYLWQERFKYTTSGSLVSSFPKPFHLNDLAWDGHYLWAGGKDGHLTKITTTGSVVTSFPAPGGGASGATFDGSYLWYVKGAGGWAYQVEIDVVGVDAGSFGKIKGLYS